MYCVRTALRKARASGVIPGDAAIDNLPPLVTVRVFFRLIRRLGGKVHTNELVEIQNGQPAIYCYYNPAHEGHALFSMHPSRRRKKEMMAIVTFPRRQL